MTQTKQLCYFSIQSPFISAHTDTDTLTSSFDVAFVCQAFRLQEMEIMGIQCGSASAIYRLQEMGIMGTQWGSASAIYRLQEMGIMGTQWGSASAIYKTSRNGNTMGQCISYL